MEHGVSNDAHMPGVDALDAPVSHACASSKDICSTLARPTILSPSFIGRRRKAPILSLPIELLAIIFTEVYRSCTFAQSRREWNPWTFASVCPFWRRAASLTPEFWTRLTIFLDVPHFSVAIIASILGRSRNLILEKVFIARNVWTPMNDEHERVRVMMVMQAIAPHMHRCRAITFDVRFSSSLPSFPNGFHGRARRLTSLRLTCLEDDGGATVTVGEPIVSPVHREPFRCPNLCFLVIDGRNYFNACQLNISWTNMFPLLSALSISHFVPVANHSASFKTSDLLLSLAPLRRSLTSFCIDNIHLDDSPAPELDDRNEVDHFHKLHKIAFRDIHNTSCVKEIMEFLLWPSYMHITRCRLDPRYNGEDNELMSLKEIDIGEDLVGFLTKCEVKKLIIDTCPGFGDEVLIAMMTPVTKHYSPSSWRVMYCALYVKDLSIRNCPDFSISVLKQLVETRRIRSTSGDPHDFRHLVPSSISAIRLSGRVPVVSLEDREWFKGCLSEFSYDPIQ